MAKKNLIEIDKKKKEVTINSLTIKSVDVLNFLSDKKEKDKWVEKALIIGCIGLKQMVLTENIDFVEKEFNTFLVKAKENFEKQSSDINEKIEDTFNMEKKNSPIAQFTTKLDKTFDMKNTDSPLSQFKDLVEDYFDSKNGKFKEVINEYFDSDSGKIKRLIDGSFDIDNKNSAFSRLIKEIKENSELEENEIKDLLDSNKTDSPAKILKEEILTKFKELKDGDLKEMDKKLIELRDKVLKDEAIEEEKAKGTVKGFDFEEWVLNELETLGCHYKDDINHVGAKKVGGSMVGDITIDLEGNPAKRIIVECKDRKNLSAKKAKDEINKAIKIRKSKFGIFLFKTKDQMPGPFKPIKITDNYIITYMEKDNLCLAYRLARILLTKDESNEDDTVDFSRIGKELIKIEDQVKNIENMQSKVTNIINSGDYLKDNLSRLESMIDASIEIIKSLVEGKLPDSPEVEEEDYITEGSSSLNLAVSSTFGSYKKDCPICGEEFESTAKSKKYCAYSCRDRLNHIKNCKSIHSLSPEDQELRLKLIKEGIL